MKPFVSLNDQRALTISFRAPFAGLWLAELEFDEIFLPSGQAIVRVGLLELRGTVLVPMSGAFQRRSRVYVVAGAGGWMKKCHTWHYHNDAESGVSLKATLSALAQDVGESFDTSGVSGELAKDFVRQAAPASRVLEQLLGSTPWWVGYDGITRAGQRPGVDVGSKDYHLLELDERSKVAELSVDDPGAVVVGSVLRLPRLARPLYVRQVDIDVQKNSLRVHAWCREFAA